MGDAGSQSLCLVLCYPGWGPNFCSILQLDDSRLDSGLRYLARFSYPPPLEPPVDWVFCSLPFSTNDLYMVPDYLYDDAISKPALQCALFNCSTQRVQTIKPPKTSKSKGVAVTMGQDIFLLAHPFNYRLVDVDPTFVVFERYISAEDRWEEQVPFPDQAVRGLGSNGYIVATAVWDDFILLNIGARQIWAYNVVTHIWYQVLVGDDTEHEDENYCDWFSYGYNNNRSKKENNRCYAIINDCFVIDNTIYALSKLSCDTVLALSINKEFVDGNLQFTCSFLSEIHLPHMSRIDGRNPWETTRCLVHMGEANFCIVSTRHFGAYRPIQVTYMKLMGGVEMVVTKVSTYRLSSQEGKFEIGCWFSRPKCKTNASKRSETTFFLNPGFGVKQEDKIDFNPEPEVGKLVQREVNVTLPKGSPHLNDIEANSVLAAKSNVASAVHFFTGYLHILMQTACLILNALLKQKARICTDEEGHSVIVINLPLHATTVQLEEELMTFGPIKRNGIRVDISLKTGNCSAFVEFESVAAKGLAIQASPIRIGDSVACIMDTRRYSLAKVYTKGVRCNYDLVRCGDHGRTGKGLQQLLVMV